MAGPMKNTASKSSSRVRAVPARKRVAQKPIREGGAARAPSQPDADRSNYIPALGADWATPFYDLLMRLAMPEDAFKHSLVEQARISPDDRVLDLGCGTATLTMLIKRSCPDAAVSGIDGDPNILKIARAKAEKAGLDIEFEEGMAFALPYADASFERVLSSLVLHHLSPADKLRACKEVFRVLGPRGEFHVADFGPPHTLLMRLALLPMQLHHASDSFTENIEGRLPDVFRSAGFRSVEATNRYQTLFGTLVLYKAAKR